MTDPGTTTPPAPGTPPAPPAPPAPTPPAGGKPASGPTADDLTKLNEWAKTWGAREKAEGRAQVEKEIAETLGMTLTEAQSLLTKQQEAERERMTAAEKKEADAAKLRADARSETKVAHDLILDMLKQDALMALGMTREQAKGAVNLVNAEVAASPEMTVANIATAADQVKVLYPQLFGTRPGPVDSTTRGGAPNGTGGGSDARDRATARLRERRGGRLRNDIVQEPRPAEHDYTRRGT